MYDISMNIHPIIIHFPIAFLTLYAVLELVRFQKVTSQPYWFYVKAILVIAGSLGALVAFITGGIASGWVNEGPRIFLLHKYFGFSTFLLSVIVAKAYGWQWFRPNRYSRFILQPKVVVSLAILILFFVTTTGGLGGAMVRGTTFDPFMKPIFKLLGVY